MNGFDFEVDVSGLDGLVNRISALPDKLQRKGATAAARKAMNMVRNAARASARQIDDPVTAEKVWKNIITQNSARGGKRIGGVHMRVGVRGGAAFSKAREEKAASNPGGYTWYWRFLELGSKDIDAEPFLLPALENQAQAVTTELSAELWRQIAKLAQKA